MDPTVIEANCLTEVNAILVHQRRDPIAALPPGQQSNRCRCPVARALTDLGDGGDDRLLCVVDGLYIEWERPSGDIVQTISTPDPIKLFLTAFDNGEIPHLIRRAFE